MAKLWLERWWWLSSAVYLLLLSLLLLCPPSAGFDFWVVLFLQERRQWLFLCFSLLFFVFWVVLHWFSFFLAGTKTMAGLICDSPLPFSPSLCIYIFCVYALFLFCDLLCFWVPRPFSRFSSPSYRDSQAASFNQSCLCRTVICHERDCGRETWSTIGSNPLQIFSLLNRDGEDEHDCSTSNGNVSAAMDIFILTPERFKLNNWDLNQ